MAFNGNEGTTIRLTDAVEWTTNYRNSVPAGSTLAHFYGKNKLMEILQQTDCVGIRIYFGIEPDGTESLVLVGANANGEDLYNGVIIDRAYRCPIYCPSKSPLNK